MIYRLIPFVLLLVPNFAAAQTSADKQATIEYVKSLQQPDGGFAAARPAKDMKASSSLRATLAAVRALKYFGSGLPNKDKVKTFVEGAFDAKTGGYSYAPGGKADVILTAIGVMAAAELQLKPQPFIAKAIENLTTNATQFEEIRLAAAALESAKQFPKEAVDRWLAEAAKLRNPDGSYGKSVNDARMTGSVVALILRVGGVLDDSARQASLKVLLNGQRDDGGFGKAEVKTSDLDSCYRITRALHLLKEKPKDMEKLKAFVAKCRNEDGGYGIEPGKPSSVGTTYYASIILHWLE